MNRMFLCIVAMLVVATCAAQYSLRVKVIQAENKEPLVSATVSLSWDGRSMRTDTTGLALFTSVPPGEYRLTASYTGYEERSVAIRIRGNEETVIELESREQEEEEVIVQSTRTSRSIRNIPTRVEVIALEEIDEKSNMRPANVSMLLHESTGIQVQQTSATSGSAGIRMQGLDGRYTQLLKDGYANFGNFASGLSVLEIPPLDLKQVEIIKGPASTLYGGGAIAGVVNFISRTPEAKPENNFLLNYSSIGQANLGYYSSGKKEKTGYTLLALVNRQRPFDVDKDDFTEVPKSLEFTLHPKFFFYPSAGSTLVIGNSFTTAKREGGDIEVIRNREDAYHRYSEKNNTVRNITTLEWQRKIRDGQNYTIKQSLSIFDRHISVPGYHFHGASYSSFTDLSYLHNIGRHTMVAGANLVYDKFKERSGGVQRRDNESRGAGLYVQDTWDISSLLKLEGGLRLDGGRYSNELFTRAEYFLLPRISLLVQYSPEWSSRIGGGLGYKLPGLFTERTESFQYQGVWQLEGVRAERSYGSTADLNFKTRLGNRLELAFNQMFFYTTIRHPLTLEEIVPGEYRFVNAARPVRSGGFETNAKLIYRRNLKLFLGYTFTEATTAYLTGRELLPLVPKHKFNSALIYEKHDFLKLGLEGYYTSPQYLYDGFRTSGFWEFGLMAEKPLGRFSVYINFENFTDTRQGRYKRVANGPHESPVFDDIWTHTEGFVVNGGVKWRL